VPFNSFIDPLSRRFRGKVSALASPAIIRLKMLAAQRSSVVAIATFVVMAALSFYVFRDQGALVVERITNPPYV
jgi:hypothetical protein